MITEPLAEVLAEAKPGFACGEDVADGIFQFRMNNITADGRIDLTKQRRVPRNIRNMEAFLVEEGDVLFNATNSPDLVGKSAYFRGLEEPAVFSNHFLRLRPQPGRIDGRFLSRWLNLQFDLGRFKGMCRQWVNQATVSRDSLLTLRIPLPALAEQRRVAEVLDRAEALRAKRRAALAQLDALTQSIFLDLFGDPASSMNRWPIRQLQDVVKTGTIVTYGIVQAGEEFAGGVPYIRTGDIADGQILTAGLRHTNPAIAAKFARSRVEFGDIVMSIRATVGTTALIPRELDGANLTQGTARISPGDETDSLYLLNWLRTVRTQHWISLQIKGATFREITLARLRELPVVLPPMALQREFARRTGVIEQLKTAQRASLAELDALFASLQQRAFRGEL